MNKVDTFIPIVITKEAKDRFLERVEEEVDTSDPDGCWIWTGTKNSCGYGRIRQKQHQYGVHRIAYEVWRGPIKDLCVCHRCDVRDCINPNHLFLGTLSDNTLDAFWKGRLPFGEKHGQAKLTQTEVDEIRALYAKGNHSQTALGEAYGITQRMVSFIVNFANWKKRAAKE